jgi:transposase-like protein
MRTQNTSESSGERRSFTVEEKKEILKAAEEIGIPQAAEKYGANARTIKYWQKKVAEEGPESLTDKRSASTGRLVPDWKKEKVLSIKESDPGFGPSQIRNPDLFGTGRHHDQRPFYPQDSQRSGL